MSPTFTPKERMAIDRVRMPELPAAERCHTFAEVNCGLSYDEALREASRCLQCSSRACVAGCPISIAIPEFIAALADDDLPRSAHLLRTSNQLATISGRVCQQEIQCEAHCVRGHSGKPVAIGFLERYVADWAVANPALLQQDDPMPATGNTVVIVGSGPGGLSAAHELAHFGHDVTIFEALHDTGGVLRYGIPEFRLSKAVVTQETERLRVRGVTIECNVIIGKTITLTELRAQYDGVFIATGAGVPKMLSIPGENLKGVYTGNEFLTRVNLMEAGRRKNSSTPIIKRCVVAVIGGGNTALDCVRTARRLGGDKAMIVYRRSADEIPARAEEIRHAREEGVEFVMLTAPSALLGTADGWVSALHCHTMALGDVDNSGRRAVQPIPGSDHELAAELVINATGSAANPLLSASAPELAHTSRGTITSDGCGATNLSGVYAGGDSVRGGATVILAMADGKRAAAALNDYLTKR